MALCSKCRTNEATIHLCHVINGRSESRDFCPACSPQIGFEGMTIEQLQRLSIVGKKCDFCGKSASSGTMDGEGPVYLCISCDIELSRIRSGLMQEKGLEFLKSLEHTVSSFENPDPETMASVQEISREAVRRLRAQRGL